MLSPRNKGAGKRFREPFGKAGLTVAILALVFAMAGGAYAAGKLTSKQKKEVEKIAKKFQGTGPAGAQGANGKDGAPGATGAIGAAGATGEQGNPGQPGQTGFTEVLPSGKTETGTWSIAVPPSTDFFSFIVPISFPIPVEKAGENAFYFKESEVIGDELGRNAGAPCVVGTAGCVDTGCQWEKEEKEAIPTSTVPGTLCVFTAEELNVSFGVMKPPGDPFDIGFGPSGSVMEFSKSGSGSPLAGTASGVWAITAQ